MYSNKKSDISEYRPDESVELGNVGNMKLCIYSRKYLNKRIQRFQDVAVPWDPATAFWVSWWDGTRQREENPANAEHRYHDIYMYFVIYDFEFIEVMKRSISCHIQKCTASHARSLSKNWQKFCCKILLNGYWILTKSWSVKWIDDFNNTSDLGGLQLDDDEREVGHHLFSNAMPSKTWVKLELKPHFHSDPPCHNRQGVGHQGLMLIQSGFKEKQKKRKMRRSDDKK